MKSSIDSASRWFYRGAWGVATRLFRVPDRPPTLPALGGGDPKSFQPSPKFLDYLLVQFWIGAAIIAVLIVIGLVGISAGAWQAGLALLPVAAVLFLGGVAIGYLAIHLRYDTTWYVVSDRSLRIRRGIWIIHETTITFENVQNVLVQQGPLQRFFGIANVRVETAGGGGGAAAQHGGGGNMAASAHQGLIEGVSDAERIRDLLLARLKSSRSAGLGDDLPLIARETPPSLAWSSEHLAALRAIRDEVVNLLA